MTDHVTALNQTLSGATCIDLSPVIQNGMPRWVTHPPLVLNATINHDHDNYYCQTISMAEHTGAHIDAPAHVHPGMMDHTIDTIPVQTFLAPAKLLDLRPLGLGPGDLADASTLAKIDASNGQPLAAGEVALLNFGWWERYWFTDHRWRWYSENTPGSPRTPASGLPTAHLSRSARTQWPPTSPCAMVRKSRNRTGTTTTSCPAASTSSNASPTSTGYPSAASSWPYH
jgi:hypothetical protein